MNVTIKKESIVVDKRGVNLLNNITPEVLRFDGVEEPLFARIGKSDASLKYYQHISTDEHEKDHIDIFCEDFALIYDLGKETAVSYFYFACFNNQYQSRMIEIYASKQRETIFDKDNLVTAIDNSNNDAFFQSFYDHVDVKVEIDEQPFRYVALKQVGTNATDGISRINLFGAYNNRDYLSEFYVKVNYPNNNAYYCDLEVNGKCSGNPEYLTDGHCDKEVIIEDGEIVFTLPVDKKISKVIVIGDEAIEPTVSDGGEYYNAKVSVSDLYGIKKEYTIDTEMLNSSNKLSIKFKKAIVDEIILLSDDVVISVQEDNVISEDFIGLGGNVLPTHLFEYSRMQGFNEAEMELEACRIAKCKPAVVRMWFQIDWFVMDGQDYYNRKYSFNNHKMLSVLKVLDAYKAAGTEVEFNFGWKAGLSSQPWFSFPNVFDRRNSAPRDLDQFAIACADCLRELIVNRGYDNIKYLTLYNEPECGDFVCPEGIDKMQYWTEMLEKVDAKLKDENLRHLVEIWGPEVSSHPAYRVWASHLNKNVSDKYDRFSYHKYRISYDEAVQLSKEMVSASNNRPVATTEFGCYGDKGCYEEFEQNNISNVIGYANGGSTAMLYWVMSRSYLDEVGMFGGSRCFWSNASGGATDGARPEYYYFSLITNYVPKHCKSIVANSDSKDLHTIAFLSDSGDYTVLVESNLANDSRIKIAFGEKVNKKFNKFLYTRDVELESNLITPLKQYDIDATDGFVDTVNGGYSFIVYTTLPPVRQVVMDKVFVTVKEGESVKLSANVLDGEGELKWSLCDTYCPTGFKGTITEDGVYTADSNFQRWTITPPVYAVKAELPTGEYGITIIKLTK